MADDTQGYNIAAIRKLLLDAFTAEGLRQFCHDRPMFRPVLDEFSDRHGLSEMVEVVITYCEKHARFPELLAEVEKVNPRQYDSYRPSKVPGISEEGAPQRTHWIWTLLLNLILATAIAGIIAVVFGSKLAAYLPCQSLWAKTLGLPLVLLAILQAGWRFSRSHSRPIDGTVEVDLKLVKKELDLTPWLDALALWPLPDRAIYVGALVMIALAVLLVWLMPGPPESTPTVESYSVHYVGSGLTVPLSLVEAAKQGIEIEQGDSVLIKANMMDNGGVRCTWYAMQRVRLITEQGCAAWYHAGLHDTDDVVGILIESKCGTRERWVSVPIKVK